MGKSRPTKDEDVLAFLAFLSIVFIPWFMTISWYLLYRYNEHPSKNGVKLSSPEKDKILKVLRGVWNIEPCDAQNVHYEFAKVKIKGNSIRYLTSTNMIQGSGTEFVEKWSKKSQLNLSRASNGTLYLDKNGTHMHKWKNAPNVLYITDASNRQFRWSRPPPTPIILPSWWEVKSQASTGQIYFWNNYKKEVLFSPPSLALLAEETNERNADRIRRGIAEECRSRNLLLTSTAATV